MPTRKARPRNPLIPNQVFLGCPWKTVRPKYEKTVAKLAKKYPLSFVIVGRDEEQNAEELLSVIMAKLLSSSHAVFDATGGNANVSLEYGIAEAEGLPRSLYLCTHGAAVGTAADHPIISDLAGKRRNTYKNVERLEGLLAAFCRQHNYTVRFERFLKRKFKNLPKGRKKRARALALKVIHLLDQKTNVRRGDIVSDLQADINAYKESEVDAMIKALHKEQLLVSSRGRYSTVSMV